MPRYLTAVFLTLFLFTTSTNAGKLSESDDDSAKVKLQFQSWSSTVMQSIGEVVVKELEIEKTLHVEDKNKADEMWTVNSDGSSTCNPYFYYHKWFNDGEIDIKGHEINLAVFYQKYITALQERAHPEFLKELTTWDADPSGDSVDALVRTLKVFSTLKTEKLTPELLKAAKRIYAINNSYLSFWNYDQVSLISILATVPKVILECDQFAPTCKYIFDYLKPNPEEYDNANFLIPIVEVVSQMSAGEINKDFAVFAMSILKKVRLKLAWNGYNLKNISRTLQLAKQVPILHRNTILSTFQPGKKLTESAKLAQLEEAVEKLKIKGTKTKVEKLKNNNK